MDMNATAFAQTNFIGNITFISLINTSLFSNDLNAHVHIHINLLNYEILLRIETNSCNL